MAELSLAAKLRIKGGQCVAIINAPSDYLRRLGELPEGISVSESLEGRFDIVQAFFTKLGELEAKLEDLKSALSDEGILWISYPKKSAKMDSDPSRDVLRLALSERALRAVALVRVVEIWSAMRFKRLD